MASGSIEGRHLEASGDGAGCGARGRETNAPPKHPGGAGAPPGGQYEPPARSWLTVWLLDRGLLPGQTARAKRGPAPQFRFTIVSKRNQTAANEPGH